MNQLKELDTTECLRLLGQRGIGRAAVATPDGPHLVPVNYAVLDGSIAIRTSPYSLLGTYARASMLAFEVDDIDEETHSGWSVVVRGRCLPETDPDDPGAAARAAARVVGARRPHALPAPAAGGDQRPRGGCRHGGRPPSGRRDVGS